jgi:hypothetical protein
MRPSGWRSVPIGLVGLAATAGLSLVAFTLAVLVLGYGCGGSDVSEPSDAALCNSAAETPLGIAMVALAIGAPLYGTVAATHHRSWRPLFLGVLVALTGIAIFLAAFDLS